MADYIEMKQVPGGYVTAKDDRIVYDANLASFGIIYGCEISYTGNNQIHINAGYGIIKGGLFEMQDHTEFVDLAEAGTVTGQIYLHLDLSADDKLTIVKQTSNSLHPMIQNEDANYEDGIFEFQLCTFNATTTGLENVTQTFQIVSMGVLDTIEEIMANTAGGRKAGALALKEVNENLTANGGIYSSFPFRVGVTSDGQLGFHDIVGGADTVRPFRNVNPVLCAVSGSTNSFSIPNADIGSIYLMFYTSKTGTYNWEEPQTIGTWGVIDKSTYSVSGGELIKVLERYITSWLPYFTKMIFVRATASTVTVTTNPDQLSTYDSPSDCIAIKLC